MERSTKENKYRIELKRIHFLELENPRPFTRFGKLWMDNQRLINGHTIVWYWDNGVRVMII